jgi:hypothetical protein
VAFGSAATILAFLLPGAGLVGPNIRAEIRASSAYVQNLYQKLTAAQDAKDKATQNKQADIAAADQAVKDADNNLQEAIIGNREGLYKILDTAGWLRTALVCTFASVSVAAASLVIGPTSPQCGPGSDLDWRAILGSVAITLLVGTSIVIAPVTWSYLNLGKYRDQVKNEIA